MGTSLLRLSLRLRRMLKWFVAASMGSGILHISSLFHLLNSRFMPYSQSFSIILFRFSARDFRPFCSQAISDKLFKLFVYEYSPAKLA